MDHDLTCGTDPYSKPPLPDHAPCRVALEDVASVLDFDAMFPDPHPVEVDVGCGKGRFLSSRAGAHPDTNFLGIDRMGSRLRKVERKIVRAGLENVRLVQLEAAYVLERLLPPAAVQAFYVFFPDPWPKRRHHRRRLISPAFLDDVSRALVPGGILNLATDHLEYFEQALALLQADARFEAVEPFVPSEEETTDFELIFAGQGKPIGRCSFKTGASA